MDEFKPEDELKPDPSDRPARGRKSAGDNEPQINFDDLDVDGDDRRPSRSRRARDERAADEYDLDQTPDDEAVTRPRRRKSKAAPAKGPVSRQYLMMGLGILVLLLLIFGIGSALNTPSTDKATAENQPAERNIDLSGAAGETAANQANGAQPQPGTTSAENPAAPQDISVPPVAATPTEGQTPATPDNQRRVEVPGDLNTALTQQQGQIDNVASGSTLPTEPATVAPVHGSEPVRQAARTEQPSGTKAAPVRERQRAVIEPAPRKTETAQNKPQAPTKASEPKPAATKPAAAKPATPAASAAPKATASTGAATGNVGALKSAPGNHYTLQLSSSSNLNNLNAWAKKENLSNVVVYKTTRNGQPWYVLVSGVYASKDEARRAVTTLPADVQAKNPWAKPIHQVQADLKQ